MRILLSWRGWLRVGESVVDRLRLVNPYSVSQMLAVCREAADEIERLRAAGDALLGRLIDWHNGAPYDLDAEAIKAWEETRRG